MTDYFNPKKKKIGTLTLLIWSWYGKLKNLYNRQWSLVVLQVLHAMQQINIKLPLSKKSVQIHEHDIAHPMPFLTSLGLLCCSVEDQREVHFIQRLFNMLSLAILDITQCHLFPIFRLQSFFPTLDKEIPQLICYSWSLTLVSI